VFEDPLVAHEAKVGIPTTSAQPREKFREGPDDPDPRNHPHDFHRLVPCLPSQDIERIGSTAACLCQMAQPGVWVPDSL
jgi:hypothetical protein